MRQRVADLLEQIAAIEAFTAAGKDHFWSDRRTQYAVMRSYEIIGEAVKNLPLALLARYPNMNWRAATGLRDILIHRYFDVNLEYVWAAVEQLPALRSVVETMAADPEVLTDDEADFI
ncbi:MAG: DUF86 domain-containing protein [Anaerolineae bacterium]|nr:DUF86 domain-containing protein [Anaerolineae bacterium]NUQ03772.1 DUF86 domain-containing protein [Anaerolineae bacterium]